MLSGDSSCHVVRPHAYTHKTKRKGTEFLEIGGFARLDVVRLSLRDASFAGVRLVSPKWTTPGQFELGENKSERGGAFLRGMKKQQRIDGASGRYRARTVTRRPESELMASVYMM